MPLPSFFSRCQNIVGNFVGMEQCPSHPQHLILNTQPNTGRLQSLSQTQDLTVVPKYMGGLLSGYSDIAGQTGKALGKSEKHSCTYQAVFQLWILNTLQKEFINTCAKFFLNQRKLTYNSAAVFKTKTLVSLLQ